MIAVMDKLQGIAIHGWELCEDNINRWGKRKALLGIECILHQWGNCWLIGVHMYICIKYNIIVYVYGMIHIRTTRLCKCESAVEYAFWDVEIQFPFYTPVM